jgi:hypothetical protein
VTASALEVRQALVALGVDDAHVEPAAQAVFEALGIGREVVIDPVHSIYVGAQDRWIVQLVVGYRPEDGGEDPIDTPLKAANLALSLTTNLGSCDTRWFVYDRETGVHHSFEQHEFEDAPWEAVPLDGDPIGNG